ncbi:LysM peptidoglycan-binding domain-containing protein [Oerskovia turbata]
MAQHAETGQTGAARGPRHAARLTTLLALTVATALAAGLLALRTLSLVETLPSPRFEAYLELPLVGAGWLLAAWVSATSSLGAACVLLHAGGRQWAAAERLVQRYAPTVVRRLTGAGVALSVGAGLALGAGSAHAAESTPPTDAAVVELGWRSTAETGPAAPIRDPQVAQDRQIAQDPQAAHGRSSLAFDAPSAAGPAADIGSPAPPHTATPPRADLPEGATAAVQDARATAQDQSGQSAPSAPPPESAPRATAATPHVPLSPLLGGGAPRDTAPQASAPHQGAPQRDAPQPGAPPQGAPQLAAPAATTPPATEPAASTVSVVVLRGDSLWALAERALGPGATDAQITAEWQRWYAANADLIGPDPGLLRPGQILQAPHTP